MPSCRSVSNFKCYASCAIHSDTCMHCDAGISSWTTPCWTTAIPPCSSCATLALPRHGQRTPTCSPTLGELLATLYTLGNRIDMWSSCQQETHSTTLLRPNPCQQFPLHQQHLLLAHAKLVWHQQHPAAAAMATTAGAVSKQYQHEQQLSLQTPECAVAVFISTTPKMLAGNFSCSCTRCSGITTP